MSRLRLMIFALFVAGLCSCHHSHGPGAPQCEFVLAIPLQMEFKTNGRFITDPTFLSGIKIRDLDGNDYVPDLTVSSVVQASDGAHRWLSTSNLTLSSTYGTHNWVIFYPDASENDTMFYNMERSQATNCDYLLHQFTLDGALVKPDSAVIVSGDSVWIINHR